MYDSTYFNVPKPYGQQSTAYRSVGNTVPAARPASSMAILISPASERVDGASLNSSNTFGDSGRSASKFSNFDTDKSDQSAFNKVTVTTTPHRIGTERWMQAGMPSKGRWNSSVTVFDTHNEPREHAKPKTSAPIWEPPKPQYSVRTSEIQPVARQVPIQVEGQRNSAPQRSFGAPEKQIPIRVENAPLASTDRPLHDEFHTTIHRYKDPPRRPNSAVPFSERAPSTMITSFVSDAGDRSNFEERQQPKVTSENVPKAESRSTFDRVQVFHGGRQKPSEQTERHHYTHLHHVTPHPLYAQRRTSDPSSIHPTSASATTTATAPVPSSTIVDQEADVPVTHAMVNVAKNVREELEKDPKFRQRAESSGERPPIRVHASSSFHTPKQSPSLIQMENYLSHLQRHQSAMELNRIPALGTPTQPFSPDAVRSIFSGSSSEQPTPTATQTPTPFYSQNVPIKMRYDPVKSTWRDSPHVAINRSSVHPFRAAPIPPPKPHVFDIRNAGGNAANKAERSENVNNNKNIGDDGNIAKTTDIVHGVSSIRIKTTPSKISSSSTDESKDVLSKRLENGKDTNAVPERAIFIARPRTIKFSFDDDDETKTPSTLTTTATTTTTTTTTNSSLSQTIGTSPPSSILLKTNVAVTQEAPPSIRQYDEAIEEPLQRFLKLSCDIGGDVKTMGEKVSSAFTQQRNFIWNAAGQKELSATELPTKLNALVKLLEEMSTFRESKRNTPQFHHLSAVSEGIQALGWLTVKPTPAPFIKDMNDASMFFVNRVRNENKDGDKVHLEWTKTWIELLNALQSYVRQVHTTGLVWNSNPGTCAPSSIGREATAATASAPPTTGGPPPPPPPPPMMPPDLFSTPAQSDAAGRAALFAEINKGEEITKGLRKVTADMQTHKNPALRAQAPASGDMTKKGDNKETVSTTKKEEVEKPPKTYLENGKRWNIEYHKNNQNIVVEIENIKQTVYAFKCENSVIQIKGKVNSITLDGCKKTSIVFDNLLSQIEVINCQRIQIQTLGTMPTLSIQKSDGCQVYLSKEAIGAEIVTSKSSEMNLLIPTDVAGDFMEFPIPEQFKTIFDGKKLQTTASDIV